MQARAGVPAAGGDDADPLYQFNYDAAPFAFGVARRGAGNASDALFRSSSSRLVFKVGPSVFKIGLSIVCFSCTE